MDYTNKEDVEVLLYTTSICNSKGILYTFDVFQKTLTNKAVVRDLLLKLERDTAVLKQFQKKQEIAGGDNSGDNSEAISNIVSTLIMAGLDARYALNEMELCDLPLYLEAYERKRKEEMESARMWTYLSMLPHIDARKMENGAKDLIRFPWEEAKEEDREIKAGEAERFEEFMKKGMSLLKQ